MAVNKVEFGNQTIMDITDTSATPEGVVEGQVFYSAAGVRSTGTLTDATQEVHGLMSAADKVKLDQLTYVPIESKNYTGVIATSDDNAGGGFFYLKVRPTEYASNWHVKTRVIATVPNNINYRTDTIFDIYGFNNGYSWYACLNNIRSTSYRGIYYNSVFFTNSTGFANNCGHWVGFNLVYAQNNTTLARDVTVELLEYNECTVELQNTLVTPTNIPDRAAHTGWYTSTTTSFSNYDACNPGLRQTGDSNTTTISNLIYSNGNHVMDSALYRYQLVFQKDENTLTPLNNANNDVGTSKTMLTEVEFNPFGKIFYYAATTTINANGAIGAGSLYYSISGLDLRYSLNCGTTLTAHKPLYLVVTPTGNEKCKIASVTPWAQTLPDFDDGNWYILLGRTYSTYQMALYPVHPIYKYNGSAVQTVTPQDIPSASSTDNGKILKVVNGAWTKADEQDISGKVTGPSSATNNAVAIFDGTTGKIIKNSGYTIGKSVPSDAIFTDTTTTSLFSRPSYQAGISDITIQPLINDLRANHLAFLPPDQVIIEKTVDGGQTWTDAGVSDDAKRSLFAETRTSISLPKIDGKKNILCGLRVTFTAMKYDVPANTPETQKYDYWNYNYVLSTERYNNLRDLYFWVSSDADKLKIKVQCATGENPTGWVTIFENNNALFQGWSGNDYIQLSGNRVFGGSTTQKSNFWNYRIIFMSAYNAGASEFSANYITNSQAIQEIRGYGTNWWTAGNKYASSDHMYSWDSNKNVTFPAKVTATNFVGSVNGYTIAASVPSGAIFTDTTYESKAAASGGTAVSLVTTGEKYTWNNKYTKPSGGIPASDLAETYLTSFTETDPTVPSWAKAASKPSYTASEVGALPSNTTYVSTVNGQSGAVTITIPTKVSDLTDDSGHYTKPSGGIPASDLASGVIPNPGDLIDDTAGTGATGKVWSADKITQELEDLPVKDVTFENASLINNNGAAIIPKATNASYGLVKPASSDFNFVYSQIPSDNGALVTAKAGDTDIKSGIGTKHLTPSKQDRAVFYGLAKAAGADEAQSAEEYGTYSTAAITAIQGMLNVPDATANASAHSTLQAAINTKITPCILDNTYNTWEAVWAVIDDIAVGTTVPFNFTGTPMGLITDNTRTSASMGIITKYDATSIHVIYKTTNNQLFAGKATNLDSTGASITYSEIDYSDTLPIVTSTDNGSFLRVVNGVWTVAAVSDANGESF